MATKYHVRAVLRNFDEPAGLVQVRFKCWRLRVYVTQVATNVVIDGIQMANIAAGQPSVLEFGGVMLNGAPVMFSQMFNITGQGSAKAALLFVEEYLDPIP